MACRPRVRQGAPAATEVRAPGSLIVGVLPMVVPLLLIATGAIANALGVESPLVGVLGEPVFALFVGLVGAYLLARRTVGADGTAEAMRGGFGFSGQILLLTGVGGALGKVVRETPLADVMAGFFSADAGVPVLVAVLMTWFTAAVLHIAIGSVNVAAVTTAGILAPVMSTVSVPLPVMALVIVSGALFAIHVNSNFFWMFQSLLGLTTRGTLKTLTFVTCITSVISLALLSVVALVVS
jgi:GntP family gluconate:H+ symporter